MTRLTAFMVWCLVISSSALVRAQPTIIDPSRARPPREGWRLLNGRWIQPAGAFRFSQVVRAKLIGPRLLIDIAPDESWQPKFISGRLVTGERLPDRSLWWMQFTKSSQIVAPEKRGTSLVLLPVNDVADDDTSPLRINGVTITPGGVIVRGAGLVEGTFTRIEYRSNRAGAAARLTVVNANQRGYDFNGDDLLALLHQQPQVVRKYLAPLLTELTGENLLRPRAADVYRAFDEIQPTPADVERVGAVLNDLHAADRETRETASRALRDIGAPAVLVAVRLDWTTLSPEQSTRLAEFVEENSLGLAEPRSARSDLYFLRAATEHDDRRVRDLARDLINSYVD